MKNYKKGLIISAVCMLLAYSCTPVKPLYYYGNYSDAYYKYIKKADEKAVTNYEASINSIFTQSEKLGIKVPPGIYAEYGYFLLQQGKIEEASKYFDLEMKTYPEATQIMSLMLKSYNK